MYDVKIVGGTLVDGTGKDRYTADLGIKDGKIVDIGKCDGGAAETIDADGAIVAPGFVDMHTHYDGQISWDEELAPSSIHGVTTCAMGSCGVGFAPVRPTDHAKLVELMEGVEDIPGTALAEGISWGWESFPEYMEVLDRMPHTIDFLAHVPHDALRVYVMGERAVHDEAATAEGHRGDAPTASRIPRSRCNWFQHRPKRQSPERGRRLDASVGSRWQGAGRNRGGIPGAESRGAASSE